MKKLFIIAVSLLLPVVVFANEECKDKTVQITGFVADNQNNEALAGATISIAGKKLYSDFDGNFSADIKPGKHQIKVELISYETIILETEVTKNENISITLPQLHTPAQGNNLAVVF